MCLSVLSFSYSPIKPPFAMLTYSLFFCNRKLEISRTARISSIILQHKDHKIICFAKQGYTILIFPVKTSSDYYFFLSMNYNDFPASASFILFYKQTQILTDWKNLKETFVIVIWIPLSQLTCRKCANTMFMYMSSSSLPLPMKHRCSPLAMDPDSKDCFCVSRRDFTESANSDGFWSICKKT